MLKNIKKIDFYSFLFNNLSVKMKQYLNKTAPVNQFHKITAKIFHGIFYLLFAPTIIYLSICKFIPENKTIE